MAVANTVVSLFYYLRVLAPVVLDDQAGPVPVLGRWAAVGTAAATTMVVGLGLGAQPFLHAAASARLLP